MSAAPLTFYWGREFRSSAPPNLLAEAQRGNRDAFAQMISPQVPALYRRARGLTGNDADAEDASQEALLKAWSRLQQFTGKQDASTDEFRAWVSRIASNASIDLLRQRHDGKVLSLEEPKGPRDETLGSTIASDAQDPEEWCARREMGQLLANAIVQLPRDLRQACLLRDVLHYSTQEVADRLGISIVAVRLRLFRAHRRLREKMAQSLQARQVRAKPATRRQATMTQSAPSGFVPLGTAASFASGD